MSQQSPSEDHISGQLPLARQNSEPVPVDDPRQRRTKSIQRRVIRLVLVPSVVALVLWIAAAGYLVLNGFYDRQVASSVREVSLPAVSGLVSIQQERRLSMAYLTEPSQARASSIWDQLIAQRKQTDERLQKLREAAEPVMSLAPEAIVSRWNRVTGYLDRLGTVRSSIDSRGSDEKTAWKFYNELLDAATDLFGTQARSATVVENSHGGVTATSAFRVSDRMSRASSVMARALATDAFSRADYLEFVSLVNAYHSELDNIAPYLWSNVKPALENLEADSKWRRLITLEQALITEGPWPNGLPGKISLSVQEWDELTQYINDHLTGLAISQADAASAKSLDDGNFQLMSAFIGSAVALVITVALIWWAVRQSRILVEGAVTVRLSKLVSDARLVVEKQLPEMAERYRRGEPVKSQVAILEQDYGTDEIGQAARVLNGSLQVAVGAVLNEVKQREASMAMLMGVARRPQRPLQRGTQIVEELQNKVGDEKLLAEIFDLHHQLTQTRRFLENLIILTGGQPPRRWRKPVLIRQVIQHAIAETQQYQRVKLQTTPNVSVVAPAVAEIIHLLAELLDNALTFSPPESYVRVDCTRVEHGVAVEIEDAGVGMVPEDLERANELVRTAPTPEVSALKGGAQLGFWVVAALAKRGGIRVTFRTSAYGGLLAVVLIPNRALTSTDSPTQDVADRALPPPPRVPLPSAPRSETGPVEVTTPQNKPYNGRTASAVTSDEGADPRWRRGSLQPPSRPSADRAIAERPTSDSGPSDSAGGMVTNDRPQPGVPASSASNPRPHPRPPLAVRKPQQHLVPELRDETRAGSGSSVEAQPTWTPEEAGFRLAQFQRGMRAGREAGTGVPPAKNDQDRKA